MRYLKKHLFKAVVSFVKGINPEWSKSGLKYPKIDLHSWIENRPTDKEDSVREISFIVEAYSNTSYDEAVNAANVVAERLCDEYSSLQIDGAEVVGIYPDGSEEIQEIDNNNVVLYRQLNRIVVTIKTV
jgi:hypothetical protein